MLSASNFSTIIGGRSMESFFSSRLKEPGAPFTAMFFCNFHQGTISNVCESIAEISGYSKHYFINGGIKAFLSIIPFSDRLALLKLCVSLGQLASWPYVINQSTPSRSLRVRVKHRKGQWISAEIVVMVLDYIDQGSIGRVFGIVRTDYDSRQGLMDGFSEEARALEPHNNQWDAKISKREREVLRLIANGHSSKMVADKLCISIHTAARHRTNLLEKFQAKNTAELVLMASRRFWL